MDRQAWIENFKELTEEDRRLTLLNALGKIMPVENEDDDPVGATRPHPRAVFTELAAKHGLIKPGDKLDMNIIGFAIGVVDLCAGIADGYGDAGSDGNAGERIRAQFYD